MFSLINLKRSMIQKRSCSPTCLLAAAMQVPWKTVEVLSVSVVTTIIIDGSSMFCTKSPILNTCFRFLGSAGLVLGSGGGVLFLAIS